MYFMHFYGVTSLLVVRLGLPAAFPGGPLAVLPMFAIKMFREGSTLAIFFGVRPVQRQHRPNVVHNGRARHHLDKHRSPRLFDHHGLDFVREEEPADLEGAPQEVDSSPPEPRGYEGEDDEPGSALRAAEHRIEKDVRSDAHLPNGREEPTQADNVAEQVQSEKTFAAVLEPAVPTCENSSLGLRGQRSCVEEVMLTPRRRSDACVLNKFAIRALIAVASSFDIDSPESRLSPQRIQHRRGCLFDRS